MPGPLYQELIEAATEQNVRVFNGAGLTIYAAPWTYIFCVKINRILTSGDQARLYDFADTVIYIYEYICGYGN
jgi:hypothetical protein